MAARGRDREPGGAGRWIVAILAVAVIGGGVGFYLAGDRVAALLHGYLANGAEGELASSPEPRAASTPPTGSEQALSDMPALMAADPASAPETWPALSPAALLDQAAAAGDRALSERGFDQPPWRRFARPFAPPAGRPLVGILVTGLGSDRAMAAAAIAGLPADVSLSFSPYASDLADWIAAARAFGHEAMVDLPMETKDARSSGELGLLIALNDREVHRRIDAIAESAPRVFGLAGDGGDALLLDDAAAARVLTETARLGLAFVDASGEPTSQGAAAAKAGNAVFARATLVLDGNASRAAIAERLAVAGQLAIRNGSVLAVARASPQAITAIADWARRLSDRGPVTAPASALLQMN